jgi:mRNA-degrading endonuclease toxin of MazEF toxin-antitoxin module
MADQIDTVTKGRIGDHIGSLAAADMFEIERAIRYQLGMHHDQLQRL